MYKQTEYEYLNGCYTRYGTRPLNVMEIKATTTLSNGMYAVAGFIPEDGISIDVYKDSTRNVLMFMEHGIMSNVDDDYDFLFLLAEDRCKELGI
jgi:hypothetical protein